MSGEVRTGYGNKDAAALGAAVLALAAPNFGDTGPWTAMGTVVAVTLILLILGYVWGHQRNLLQVLAVAGLSPWPARRSWASWSSSFKPRASRLSSSAATWWPALDPRATNPT